MDNTITHSINVWQALRRVDERLFDFSVYGTMTVGALISLCVFPQLANDKTRDEAMGILKLIFPSNNGVTDLTKAQVAFILEASIVLDDLRDALVREFLSGKVKASE